MPGVEVTKGKREDSTTQSGRKQCPVSLLNWIYRLCHSIFDQLNFQKK